MPYAPLNLDAIMTPVPRQEEPAGLVRHGRVGRDGLLQHRRGAEEEHPEARDLEGPDQAGLQGPDRDAEPGLVGHRLLRRHRLAARSGATRTARAAAGSTWTRCTRTSRSTRTRARSPATWPAAGEFVVGISFEYRANANKAKGAPIDLVFPKEGLGWDLEAFAIHKGTKKLDAAKKLADWASSKDAMLLYGKNFAITAQPGVAAPLANVPADYESAPGQDGLRRAPPKNRERILDEWNKRYNAKSREALRPRDGDGRYLRPARASARSSALSPRCTDIDLAIAPGRVRLLPRPLGLRQDDAAAHHRRARDADRRHASCQAGRDISRAAAGASATTASSSSRTRCFPTSSVADNVAYGLVNRSVPTRAASRRASTSCSSWSACRAAAPSIPAQLSGGQQQRIALARALATSPGLLLLDEPLSALDALVRVRLRQEIRALQQQLGVTTIMVTHDQEEALSMADRIVVMNQGVIEQIGTPMRGLPRPGDAVRRRLRRQDQRAAGPAAPGRRPAHRRAAASSASTTPTPSASVQASTCGPRTCWRGRSRAGDANVVRRRDREDRVPRRVLPGARQRRGDRRAAAHRLPVAQLPGRAGARGRQPAAAARCCPSACASSERAPRADRVRRPAAARRARAAPARALDRPHRPRALLALVAAALVVFLRAAAGDDPRQGAAGRRRRTSSASPTSSPTSRTPALLQSIWNSVWVSTLVTADHDAARLRLRLRAHAQLHAASRRCSATSRWCRCSRRRCSSAISLIYWFGNQGVLKGWSPRSAREHLRRARHRHRRVLRRLPARADDPGHRALARRRAPLRGGRRARHARRGASSSPSRCRAPSTA